MSGFSVVQHVCPVTRKNMQGREISLFLCSLLCKANQQNTEWNDPITTGKWQNSKR
jgi:hypothetical protein